MYKGPDWKAELIPAVVREVQKTDMLQDVESEREFPTGRPKLSTTCKGTYL